MGIDRLNIGISCIGSGVGQSVVTSCKLSNLPLHTIGLGNNPYAFGAYECDENVLLPSIYEKDYIDKLIRTCHQMNIQMLIPGRDDEVLFFAQNEERFLSQGIQTINSKPDLVTLCRDKQLMTEYFGGISHHFVKTYSKEELIRFDQISFPLIAKPKDGFASKGLKILWTQEDLVNVDPNLIIQEMAIPRINDIHYSEYMKSLRLGVNPQISEISVQLVAGKDGTILGKMASYNRLSNGVPIEILPYDNVEVWGAIDPLIPVLQRLGLRGPLNLQGRMTENGFKMFEFNPRFTGITGLRAIMGFNEVDVCIRSWLDMPTRRISINTKRFGLRQTTDKSVLIEKSDSVRLDIAAINTESYNRPQKIIITGGTGFLGQHVINLLMTKGFHVSALSTNTIRAEKLFLNSDLTIFSYDDLEKGKLNFGEFDLLLHMGFERNPHKFMNIAGSLWLTGELFSLAIMHQIPSIINVSSQSVYGTHNMPFWKENDPVAPESTYAQAKYATEVMLNGLLKFENHVRGTSIRLSTLSGGTYSNDSDELLYKLVDQVINNKQLSINGGKQKFERLDVRDAADGIVRVVQSDVKGLNSIYNLGSSQNYELRELVDRVVKISREFNLKYELFPSIIASDDERALGMDSSMFYSTFDWTPRFDIEDIIHSLFEKRLEEKASK